MWAPASVLACALSILGRSEAALPPIQLIDSAPPGVSARAEAFVNLSTRIIYLVTSSDVFLEARADGEPCRSNSPIQKIASIIAHEEWHVRHGSDERGAYQQQLRTLVTLGVSPTSQTYRNVQRSMLRVLDAQRIARPDHVLADGGAPARRGDPPTFVPPRLP